MSTTLETIRRPIEGRMEEFNDFVRKSFAVPEGSLLHDMVDYIISSRGKGLRPIIAMLSAGANSKTGDFGTRTLLSAMLVEMLHVASLVHDDVIDESDCRRGRASVNARWQSRNAVIIGDYILARNVDLGLQSGQFDLLKHIISSVATLCEGEILQSDHASKLDTTRDSYYDIIYKKTACLMATAASAGAMSVGADRRQIQNMRDFGSALGMAFQIVDDILDYSAGSSLGKPLHNDLKERKITLPLIEALESVDQARCDEIVQLIGRCHESDQAIEDVCAFVTGQNGIEKARKTLQIFIHKALSCLSELPATEYRASLMHLCEFVAEREY